MNKIKVMTDLKIGECAIVESININGSMRRRLQDLGLIDKTLVQCVLKSPGGDPIAYKIRGAVIALRNEDSDNITIGGILK